MSEGLHVAPQERTRSRPSPYTPPFTFAPARLRILRLDRIIDVLMRRLEDEDWVYRAASQRMHSRGEEFGSDDAALSSRGVNVTGISRSPGT